MQNNTMTLNKYGMLTAMSRSSSSASSIESVACSDHSKLHILIMTTLDLWDKIVHPIASLSKVEVQVVCRGISPESPRDIAWWEEDAAKRDFNNGAIPDMLCRWADVLVLAPIDANRMAKMLCGICDDLGLTILRSWDTTKNILLVPSMTQSMWTHPTTRKQLNKIRKKWQWIRVYPPILLVPAKPENLDREARDGIDTLVETIQQDIISRNFQQGPSILPGDETHPVSPTGQHGVKPSLPRELWSMILEFVGDWEVATALNVYTNLPTPPEWRPFLPREPKAPGLQPPRSLEYTILTGTFTAIRNHLSLTRPPLRSLSTLATKLIVKFARTDILSHLSTQHKDIFWSTFGLTSLPTKASAIHGKTEILSWWLNSPAVLKKEYTNECVDGASRSGFVHVLDWWRRSGLPMRYTEKALEQASANGYIDVLEWWNTQSRLPVTPSTPDLPLKIGKSIITAAQAGRTQSLLFWHRSSLPYSHEESVAKIASTHGHVPVLQLWLSLKGSKMIYDVSVLAGATKNGHTDVLEWWKRSGLRVEFRTCDIEEAIEDCVGGGAAGEQRVRDWWSRNGLNLGVGTSEWMKVKVLGGGV